MALAMEGKKIMQFIEATVFCVCVISIVFDLFICKLHTRSRCYF